MPIVEKHLPKCAVFRMLTRARERILFNMSGMCFMVSLYASFYEYYIEIKSILTLQSINNVEKDMALMIGRL